MNKTLTLTAGKGSERRAFIVDIDTTTGKIISIVAAGKVKYFQDKNKSAQNLIDEAK